MTNKIASLLPKVHEMLGLNLIRRNVNGVGHIMSKRHGLF